VAGRPGTAAAGGRLALTTYAGHLVLFHVTVDQLPVADVAEGWVRLVQVAVASSLGPWLWLRVAGRGPLEAVVRLPWRRVLLPAVRHVAAARSR
jgi:uncharacterized membrane protein YeiB